MKVTVILACTLAFLFSTVQAKQCIATAYYHKKVAYNSGIYFQHGKKHHAASYGSFWDGVNETETKNIGLKRYTFGYDKDMVGYIWGNTVEYGYMGSGRGFLLGLQAAVGSISGLMTPEVERAFKASYNGKKEGTWNQTSGLPSLASPAGASAATGLDMLLNRTQIEDQLRHVTEENDDDNPTAKEQTAAAPAQAAPQQAEQQVQQRRDELSQEWEKRGEDEDEDCEEEEATQSHKQKSTNNSSDEDDDEDCDEDEDDNGFKHGPEESAVYHAPWKTSKPVYFYGECEHCDKKTGFNKNGHGSFQSCSLIYQGKEYKGKPAQTDDMYTCVVDFECA